MRLETTLYFVDDIIVPKGRRRANEDRVKEMAESIAEVGQLQPIVIVEDNETEKATLVAGLHRLMAFKMLRGAEGHGDKDRILASITDLTGLDAELAEIDENLVRFELTAAERAKYTARRKQIYLAKYPETGHGKAPGAKGTEKGGKAAPDTKEPNPGSFVSETSKTAGRSKSSVKQDARRGEKVTETVLDSIVDTDLDTGANLDTLAKLPPERQEEVVKHAQGKGIKNLKTAKRNLEKKEAIKGIENEPAPLPGGPFRVIASDPPWPYDRVDDPTHRGQVTYETMTLEDIEALGVEAMAHDDCVLWLWTTNSFMHEAYHVVEAWGFEPKTILTWKKPKMGVGNYLRNITEHCIVAVRGKPVFDLTNETTLLEAEAREHSRKPEEFYSMVEKLCPGSRVEMFAREEREGWDRWGSETEKFSGDQSEA